MRFDIFNRFTGAVQFSCELDCPADALPSVKLGLAVKVAIKERANLSRANLSGADLSGAYLNGAYLSGADLSRDYLKDAKDADLAIARTRILADGDITGWKKCQGGVIVKLRIPADAKRSHAFGRKCRAEFADVLEVHGAEFGISMHDGKTKYSVGERVIPDGFDDDWTQECSSGVHFYISRIEAENH